MRWTNRSNFLKSFSYFSFRVFFTLKLTSKMQNLMIFFIFHFKSHSILNIFFMGCISDLHHFLGLNNFQHLLDTTPNIKERRVLATSLVLAFLRYFHCSDSEQDELIQQANDWFAKTQRRSVPLPDGTNATCLDENQNAEPRTGSLENAGTITSRVRIHFFKTKNFPI